MATDVSASIKTELGRPMLQLQAEYQQAAYCSQPHEQPDGAMHTLLSTSKRSNTGLYAACVYPAEGSNSTTIQLQCRTWDGIIMQQPCAPAMHTAEERTGTVPVLSSRPAECWTPVPSAQSVFSNLSPESGSSTVTAVPRLGPRTKADWLTLERRHLSRTPVPAPQITVIPRSRKYSVKHYCPA